MMRKALIAKIESAPNPYYNIQLPYGSKGTVKAQWSPEEDFFLVRFPWPPFLLHPPPSYPQLTMTYKHGYGKWDAVKAEIANNWNFRFDWFVNSRTTIELQKRCDYLLKLIEKEVAEKTVDPEGHMANRPGPMARKAKPQVPPEKKEKKVAVKEDVMDLEEPTPADVRAHLNSFSSSFSFFFQAESLKRKAVAEIEGAPDAKKTKK